MQIKLSPGRFCLVRMAIKKRFTNFTDGKFNKNSLLISVPVVRRKNYQKFLCVSGINYIHCYFCKCFPLNNTIECKHILA